MLRDVRSTICCGVFCLCTAFLAGCGEVGPAVESQAGAAMINNVCPVMGGAAKPDVTVEWNGQTIGFCCPPCIEEWNELTDEERAAKLAAARKARPEDGQTPGDADHTHGDAGHTHSDTGQVPADAPSADAPAAEALPSETGSDETGSEAPTAPTPEK